MSSTHFFGYPAKLVVNVDGTELEIEKFLKEDFTLDLNTVLDQISEFQAAGSPAYYKVADYPRRFTFRLEAEEFRYLLGGRKSLLPIYAYNAAGKRLPSAP